MKRLCYQRFLEIRLSSLQLASNRGTSIGLGVVKFIVRLWDRVIGMGTLMFLQCILLFIFRREAGQIALHIAMVTCLLCHRHHCYSIAVD